MKVLLIHPPPAREQDMLSGIRYPPLGITILAAVLRDKGYQVCLLESYGLNATLIDVKKKIIEFKPDVLGITAASHVINHAFKIAEIAKSINKKVKIVIGGVHPTIAPEHSLSNKNVDVIVKSEGEITFPDLLDAFKTGKPLEKIDGIGFIEGNKPFLENLEKL